MSLAGSSAMAVPVSVLSRHIQITHTNLVKLESINTHILHRSVLVCTGTGKLGIHVPHIVYTYVQVLPVCTGQSVLYMPMYRLAARHLLVGQYSGLVMLHGSPARSPGSRLTGDSTKKKKTGFYAVA